MKERIFDSIKRITSEKFRFWEVIILMTLTAIVGVCIGSFVIKKNYGNISSDSLSPSLQEFINNYNYILNNYYGDVEEERLLNNALQAILEEIDDPYAAYFDEEESSNFNIQLNGSYKGLGISVANIISTNELVVTSVFENSPAERAGMQAGDIIIKLNGESIKAISSYEFANKIQSFDENFTLTILRNDKEFDVQLKLDSIIIKSVDYSMLENHIGYIYISIFADNTYDQVKIALDFLKNNGMQSLIIDVRNNTGGYLSSVEKILGLFLDSSHVIYQIEDKNGVIKAYSRGTETADYNIAILTNENSASASEILTAALKEELAAVSVGKKTYGKGSAQKLHTLSDGTKYKFTTQRWLTPSGQTIDGVGISPDYEVALDDSYYSDSSLANDKQLQTAVEVIKRLSFE